MNQIFFHPLLLLFLAITSSVSIHAGSGRKPRCTSFQETSRRKAKVYLGHVREFAGYFPTKKQTRADKLLQALNLIDEQFQNNSEVRDLGSIIGSHYFPQSLINCIFEFCEEGSCHRLDLLLSLMITEFQYTKALNLSQTMNIFSAVNNLLIIFLAAFLSTQKDQAGWHSAIEYFFHAIFEAQKIPLKIPFSIAHKLERAYSI